MGNQQAIQYASFIEGTEKPGYSKELISTLVENPSKLVDRPAEDVDTMLKAFQRSLRRFPNNNYLGTRDELVEGRPYKWRTWRECDEITTNLAQGLITLKKDGKAQSLENIVSFDPISQDLIDQGQEVGIKLYQFWDLVNLGEGLTKIKEQTRDLQQYVKFKLIV